MTADILRMSCRQFRNRLIFQLAACIFIAVAAIAVNVCLAVFMTDATYTVFLVINIVVDIAAFWAIYSVVAFVTLPRRGLLGLYRQCDGRGEEICGTFLAFEGARRAYKYDCLVAVIDCDGSPRKVFVIKNTIEDNFCESRPIRLSAVNNIAIKCGGEDE